MVACLTEKNREQEETTLVKQILSVKACTVGMTLADHSNSFSF
jgi:hypothetical protein